MLTWWIELYCGLQYVNHMELNYKKFGQGEPLLILHGLFGTLDNWQTLAKKFAEHYTVFIIDQRNHGKSPHLPDFDYPTLAEDLCSFMEDNWIYKANILGHSMGGKTVMQFALEYPDMVDKMIVVDIAPKGYAGGHDLIFEALFSLDLNTLENRKTADEILSAKIPEFGVRQFLLKNLTKDKETGKYRWKMNLPVIFEHYQNILAPIEGEFVNIPGLFIKGERSEYISDDTDFKELFPDASLHTIREAGHWVHADQPQELLQRVLDFLQNE